MKCFLTGSTGNLGRELIKVSLEFNISYVESGGREQIDITNPNSVACFYEEHENELQDIGAIVHCAACTNTTWAETNRYAVIESNIIGTKNIGSLCRILNVPLVYISTDYVYPGLDGNYKETDDTMPVNFYSLTKLAGEAYAFEHDLVIRTSFKPSIWEFPKAFSDVYTSADYIDIIARKISFLIANNANGIYNVGTEKKSIYELAKRRNPNIQPMSKSEIKDVRIPSDISMNTDKYEEFLSKTIGGCYGR